MEAFINTAAVVALGEMGDKTQVLALLLAMRYHKPIPILIGIFFATLLSMGLTALLGSHVAQLIPQDILRWILVALFFAVAVWTFIPEEEDDDDDDEIPAIKTNNLILLSFATFLLAELGDKSQLATLVMAATYQDVGMVMCGSTIGEMLAIAPAVLVGKTTAQWIPLKWIRWAAAALFALLGLWVLVFGLG